MTDWTIRSAGERDFASVLRLWAHAQAAPTVSDTHEGLERLLGADRGALLLAEPALAAETTSAAPAEHLLGSLIAAWDGWRGSFYRLAVHPDHRRRGIATALLREGERRLRERGALRLTAIVADLDPGAMSFWEASGYRHQLDRTRFVSP